MGQRSADPRNKILALMGSAVLVAALIWALRSDSPVSESRQPAAATAPSPERPNDRTPALPRPSASPLPAMPATHPDTAVIPLTALPLRLLVISARAGGTHSFAQIADIQHGHEQLVVEGTVLRDRPRVVLARIEADRVLLDNYGVTEQLPLDPFGQRLPDLSDAAEAPHYEPSIEERERRRELSRRLRDLTDEGADREPRREVGGLLAEADMRPLYGEDGSLRGVQLDEIEPGSVFDGAGLRNGDVVTAVNGVSLGEPAMIAGIASDLITSDRLEVAVERENGAEEVVTLSTRKLLESASAYLETGGELPANLEELLPSSPPDTAPEPGDAL